MGGRTHGSLCLACLAKRKPGQRAALSWGAHRGRAAPYLCHQVRLAEGLRMVGAKLSGEEPPDPDGAKVAQGPH